MTQQEIDEVVREILREQENAGSSGWFQITCPNCHGCTPVKRYVAGMQIYCTHCANQIMLAPVEQADPAESFDWWRDRQHGREYTYVCPKCRTESDLRKRVTQKERVCPCCKYPIRVEQIDTQLEYREPQRQQIMTEQEQAANAPVNWWAVGAVCVGIIGLGVAAAFGAAYLDNFLDVDA